MENMIVGILSCTVIVDGTFISGYRITLKIEYDWFHQF